jgi:chemotaxis protein methyltransferase WspC
MSISAVKEILNRTIGLDVASIGDNALERAVRHRMDILNCSGSSYYRLIREDRGELSELIEEVVVHETWFFRDMRPFELLARDALKKNGNEQYRVLCAPCSSGEEAYSAAISLIGSGRDKSSLKIIGTDISTRAIEKAKAGIYGSNSFRYELPSYASRYFEDEAGEKRVSAVIKGAVDFTKGNILDGDLPEIRFDAVFCRNFMIYLDGASREKLLGIIETRLKPDALLFVGHAEAMPLLHRSFTPVKAPGAFAFRNRRPALVPVPEIEQRPVLSKQSERGGVVLSSGRRNRFHSGGTVYFTKPVDTGAKSGGNQTVKKDSSVSSLADVRMLADRGQVREALNLCDSILKSGGPDADVFYFEGLLHETLGNTALAEGFYRKSLYMNPHHTETLAHMLLLAEASGDEKQAVLLRGRLERAAGIPGE